MVPLRGQEALTLIGVDTRCNPDTSNLPKLYNQKALVVWKEALDKTRITFDNRSGTYNWLSTLRYFREQCTKLGLDFYDRETIKSKNAFILSTVKNSRLKAARLFSELDLFNKVSVRRTYLTVDVDTQCHLHSTAVFESDDPTLSSYLTNQGFLSTEKGVLEKQVSTVCTIKVNFNKTLIRMSVNTDLPFLVNPHMASKRAISMNMERSLNSMVAELPISNLTKF